MREAGDVCYADVFRDGTGVVDFVRKEDMTYAVRKLDNTKFRSHEVGFTLTWFWPELDTKGLTVGREGKERVVFVELTHKAAKLSLLSVRHEIDFIKSLMSISAL